MEKASFLNYYKTILEKVSFDSGLLEKEYLKAQKLLDISESKELEYWLFNSGLVHKLRPVSKDQSLSTNTVD